jgi:CHAD domain-containing protein
MAGGRSDMVQRPKTTVEGEQCVRDLAARTIRRRLESVWRELHAACDDRTDGERIHRLRIATRRAIAALDAFTDLVPGGGRRWFRRRLRELRRAAGDARDLDVLADRLARDALPAAGNAARRRLVGMLARERPAARQPVLAQRERLVESHWSRRVGRLVDRVARGHNGPPSSDYCRKHMKRLVRRFFDRADHKPRRQGDLHRLRIDGKRLRYALEIFSPALPRRPRKKCEKALECLQDCLGRYLDHAAVADRVRRWSARHGAAGDRRLLAAIRHAEDDAADRSRSRFVRWWTQSRRRDLRKSFRRALRKESA